MAYVIQVNSVDLEKNVALGIDLPMVGAVGAVFKSNYFSLDQAVANAKNLLLTEPGERVMLPTFGCGLKKALFEQLTTETLINLEARIRNTFQTFLPYIFIQNLVLTPNDTRQSIAIRLDISLNESGIDTRSIFLEVNGGT
jgi:phage baseplate assembly protein W